MLGVSLRDYSWNAVSPKYKHKLVLFFFKLDCEWDGWLAIAYVPLKTKKLKT